MRAVKKSVSEMSRLRGDPKAPYGSEPKPHGKRLNLGRYGGTEEASKSRELGFKLIVR